MYIVHRRKTSNPLQYTANSNVFISCLLKVSAKCRISQVVRYLTALPNNRCRFDFLTSLDIDCVYPRRLWRIKGKKWQEGQFDANRRV